MPPVFDLEKCTGCGICEECMADAIYIQEVEGKRNPFLKYPDEAWNIRFYTDDRRANGYPNDIVACEDVAFTSKLTKYGKIKFSRKMQGYFSLRFFKKYGYVKRLAYWGKVFFRFLISGSGDVLYKR